MAQVNRLQPHDPIPEGGRFVLVLRRFGEDAPNIVITEIITADDENPSEMRVAVHADGSEMDFDEAISAAVADADRRTISSIYAVDRTAGPRERQVLAHGGDHAIDMNRLDDQMAGEIGTDLRDRPQDAGYNPAVRR